MTYVAYDQQGQPLCKPCSFDTAMCAAQSFSSTTDVRRADLPPPDVERRKLLTEAIWGRCPTKEHQRVACGMIAMNTRRGR